MEMCYLRGDRRSGDYGEPTIDENGSGAKHEKQEKVRHCMGKTFNPEEYSIVSCPVCIL